MSVAVEKLEHNMAKLTIEVPADEFESAMKKSYNRQKKKISLPGFRKGKVPYAMVLRMYGPEVFYDDAANYIIREEYPKAADECGEVITSVPEIDVEQIEKGSPFIFTATVALKPDVEVGDYIGVDVYRSDDSVTDEEVEERIREEQKNNGRLVPVERQAKIGDTVDIDFEGYMDGELFDGGASEGYTLELGSHSFVDTFEDQIAGHSAGDEFEVNVTFPHTYQSEDLAGKPALFKVKLNGVREREYPELDDEFAMDVSEYDTMDEYRKHLKEEMEEKKAEQSRIRKETQALEYICEHSEADIPEAMVETQVEDMFREMQYNLAQSGITMDMYYQYTGTTMEGLREQCREQANTQIIQSLVIEKIADKEGIEVSDEDMEEEYGKLAETFGQTADEIKKSLPERELNRMKDERRFRKAMDFVLEKANEIDPPEGEDGENQE